MSEFDPNPGPDAVEEARSQWRESTDTFGRIYDVILGITAPTPHAEIAEIADCSPNAARKHLDRLSEMGIARAHRDSRQVRYKRNDGYLEWQEASQIARQLSVEEIIERVQTLEAKRTAFEERFGTTDPSTVSIFDQDDHDAIHERMATISEWQSIGRDIRLCELARRMAQNDGHVMSA